MPTAVATNPSLKCKSCSRITSPELFIEHGGANYCDYCIMTCNICTNKRPSDNFANYRDGAGRLRTACESCVEAMSVCNRCEYPSQSLPGQNLDGDAICNNCVPCFSTCSECDTRYDIEYGLNCDCGDDYRDDESSVDNNGVHGHGYKPRPVFHGAPKSGLFYGVELEVEVNQKASIKQNVNNVKKLLGDFAYCKHDGSINHGFEIVTHPASLIYQKEALGKFLEEEHRDLRSQSTTNCGCHIHVSRDPLVGLTIPKILAFVNNTENHPYIKKIAQRINNQYCRVFHQEISRIKVIKKRGKFKKDEVAKGSQLEFKMRDVEDNGRYMAVNLFNEKTIEFRIFKGTLSMNNMMRYLEFCDALVHFCSPSNRPLKETSKYQNFINYVDSEVNIFHEKTGEKIKRYPYLSRFHATKGPFNSL